MELVHNYQININELCNEKIDYFIAASDYQKRSTFLAENFKKTTARKLLLSIENDQKNEPNIKIFEDLGFIPLKTIENKRQEIEDILNKICEEKSSDILNILVDYSCMTKVCYASIVDFLLRNDLKNEKINMFFSYTPKSKNALPSHPKLRSIDPLFSYYKKENTRKTALVIGLNSNEEPTTDIIKHLDPEKIVLFIPQLNHDQQYNEALYNFNQEVIKNVPKNNVYNYPANNPDQIASMLTSVCLDLRLNYNVVLIPQGPKPFALASILLSTKYPDIRLMEISSSEIKPNDEGAPVGDPVIVKSVFCSEEEEDY